MGSLVMDVHFVFSILKSHQSVARSLMLSRKCIGNRVRTGYVQAIDLFLGRSCVDPASQLRLAAGGSFTQFRLGNRFTPCPTYLL